MGLGDGSKFCGFSRRHRVSVADGSFFELFKVGVGIITIFLNIGFVRCERRVNPFRPHAIPRTLVSEPNFVQFEIGSESVC